LSNRVSFTVNAAESVGVKSVFHSQTFQTGSFAVPMSSTPYPAWIKDVLYPHALSVAEMYVFDDVTEHGLSSAEPDGFEPPAYPVSSNSRRVGESAIW